MWTRWSACCAVVGSFSIKIHVTRALNNFGRVVVELRVTFLSTAFVATSLLCNIRLLVNDRALSFLDLMLDCEWKESPWWNTLRNTCFSLAAELRWQECAKWNGQKKLLLSNSQLFLPFCSHIYVVYVIDFLRLHEWFHVLNDVSRVILLGLTAKWFFATRHIWIPSHWVKPFAQRTVRKCNCERFDFLSVTLRNKRTSRRHHHSIRSRRLHRSLRSPCTRLQCQNVSR